MIKTTRQAKHEAKRLFGLCLVGGKFDQDRARQVVRAAVQSGHRGYLTVLRYFHRLVKLELAQRTAEVESAVPLPTDLQADVRIGLEGLYGSGLTTLFGLNPELIGGMRIKVGNDVFDGSVRSRLTALARSFGITGGNGRKAEG
jgi:F-type H+-transporting ATPase subunit delta